MKFWLGVAVLCAASLSSSCSSSDAPAFQEVPAGEFRDRLDSVCDGYAERYDELFRGITDRDTQELVELQEDLLDLVDELVADLRSFAPEDDPGRWEEALALLDRGVEAAREESPPDVNNRDIGAARRELVDEYDSGNCFP